MTWFNKKRPPVSFEAALAKGGFVTIIAVGFKEEAEDYRIKIAANPVLKSLPPGVWDSLVETISAGLDQLYDTPLDDLEIQGPDIP